MRRELRFFCVDPILCGGETIKDNSLFKDGNGFNIE